MLFYLKLVSHTAPPPPVISDVKLNYSPSFNEEGFKQSSCVLKVIDHFVCSAGVFGADTVEQLLQV